MEISSVGREKRQSTAARESTGGGGSAPNSPRSSNEAQSGRKVQLGDIVQEALNRVLPSPK